MLELYKKKLLKFHNVSISYCK